jgi:molybdenum cofactor guanylyltransferase
MGAVLAGGRGRRVGGAKALLELGGRPLASYPLAALRAAGLETVVVAKPGSVLSALDARVIAEPAEPAHPLRGILTALEVAGGRSVLVCGCDMPFVEPGLVSHLARQPGRLVMPAFEGLLQPLLGLYSPALAGPLELALEAREPLQKVARELVATTVEESELRSFGDPARLLFNVNTRADLEHAEVLLAADPPTG